MDKFVVFTALFIAAGTGLATLPARSADAAPCEDVLKELRAALDAAKLSDADAAMVQQLEDKGIERCNADDDKGADDFFGQAMKIAGKQAS